MQGKILNIKRLSYITLMSSLLMFNTSYAEPTTATVSDIQGGEIAIIRQAIEQQQKEDQATAVAQHSAPISVRPKATTGEEVATALPALDQPVIDPMQLLSDAERSALSQKILEIYQTGKAQIGIVMVPTTGQQDIFSYSLNIAEDWGLGSEKYDNGLLIVVAKNDRKLQILTGYGLEGVIPDIVVNRIIRNQITPQFKNEQYSAGLLAGLNEIQHILNLDPEIARQAADQLREQEDAQRHQAQAQQSSISRAFIILVIAVIASSIVGRRLASVGAGVAGVVSGLIAGSGLLMSLLMGLILFVLVVSKVAQGVAQVAMNSRGGGGGSGGFGGGRGGGFSGGGGGFGGGGASGSW